MDSKESDETQKATLSAAWNTASKFADQPDQLFSDELCRSAEKFSMMSNRHLARR